MITDVGQGKDRRPLARTDGPAVGLTPGDIARAEGHPRKPLCHVTFIDGTVTTLSCTLAELSAELDRVKAEDAAHARTLAEAARAAAARAAARPPAPGAGTPAAAGAAKGPAEPAGSGASKR